MKKILLLVMVLVGFTYNQDVYSQCTINAYPDVIYICIGDSVYISSTGTCANITSYFDDFNNGQLSSFWEYGSFGLSADFTNPCPPSVDSSIYLWFGENTALPRFIFTQGLDVSDSTCEISFHMKYSEHGQTSPCEGPDLSDEGVHLQYSLNNYSGPWIDLAYWDPNGGHDTNLINWNSYIVNIPDSASSTNTSFRWFQDNPSLYEFDHWGIDNVRVSCASESTVSWSHGPTVFQPTNPVYPTNDSLFIVSIISNDSTVSPAYDTVFVNVDQFPTAYNVTGGGAYTIGGSGLSIELDGSDLGVDYTLYYDGYITNIVKIGTGSSINFGSHTMLGTYTVSAKSQNAYCAQNMNDSAVIYLSNSIENNSFTDFNIYPNPTSGRFTVEGEGMEQIIITDMSGKTILEQEVNNDIIEIDLSSYAKAMYYVKVYTEYGEVVEKLILK